VGHLLLLKLVSLAPGPLRLVLDDTLCTPKGPKVFGLGVHVDAVRSTRKTRLPAPSTPSLSLTSCVWPNKLSLLWNGWTHIVFSPSCVTPPHCSSRKLHELRLSPGLKWRKSSQS